MGRATTKSELIQAANAKMDEIGRLLDAMTLDEQSSVFLFGAEQGREAHWGRDQNVRDVLAHLYEWHQLILNWVKANQAGEAKTFLPSPYNWRTYGKLNLSFWEKHQETTFIEARRLLEESHVNVIAMMDDFSNEELFEKGRFPWVGNVTLGSYYVSATASHYDWAIKKIKAHMKTYRSIVNR